MEQKHTKLPWVARAGYPPKRMRYVTDSEGRTICDTDDLGCTAAGSIEEVEANAEFIVHACNSHYDLLEACKTFLGIITTAYACANAAAAEIDFGKLTDKAEGRD